jgi:hypothetical protein
MGSLSGDRWGMLFWMMGWMGMRMDEHDDGRMEIEGEHAGDAVLWHFTRQAPRLDLMSRSIKIVRFHASGPGHENRRRPTPQYFFQRLDDHPRDL